MKIGLGLYREQLTAANFRFAKQAGATHIVAHLVSYQSYGSAPTVVVHSPGSAPIWTESELVALRKSIEAEGLQLEAIENLDPAHWYDVLLDGPKRDAQLANLKTMIRSLGAARIPILGYYFSIAGVWGQEIGPWARGGAQSLRFRGLSTGAGDPIPHGVVWNMAYRDEPSLDGGLDPIGEPKMWERVEYFLSEIVPVAEEAGVVLAAHPDDPPLPALRGAARLLYTPAKLQQLLDLVPSSHSKLEFCQGTLAEMPGHDLYATIAHYSAADAIGYVHFRNVRGTAPDYRETFVDDGDTDMQRALRVYQENGFDGVFVPDHVPFMSCEGPWHAGMAHALGYMRACMQAL